MRNKKRIAIIGSGISGLSAAYFLKDKYEITLYEKDERLGGHSRTIYIKDPNLKEISVDTGFIVLNNKTYPNLISLFSDIKVELIEIEMTFSVSDNFGQLEWSGTSMNTFFAQRKNIFNPYMLRGVFDIFKFNKKAMHFVQKFPNITLAELVEKMNLKSWFLDYYILPQGGAIWSSPSQKIMEFPAATFVNFFHNHGLLSIRNRPQWYTLKNKSISYVQTMSNLVAEKNRIIRNASINYIRRTEVGVEIKEKDMDIECYDQVVFACHPTEIMKILDDTTTQEKVTLSKFAKQKNTAYTHRDAKQMPRLKSCWSSWNYISKKHAEGTNSSITYWMNNLQHIDTSSQLFVTLNPITLIPDEKIYDIYDFYHPLFDHKSIEGQNEVNSMQGVNNIWYCGAYLRYGFHEDGIWSAINIANQINRKFP